MKLFYFNKRVNFGDTINPWFWSHYIESSFEQTSDQLFVGIGTLINNRIPDDYREVHIMGSGAGYGDFIPLKRENWRIHCLRGPLSAKSLGVDEKLAIADPAILLNEISGTDPKRNVTCGFMPHLGIDSKRLKEVIETNGILYISPTDEPRNVIEAVGKCERLICSAMHGAILAEALRIPWYPVSTSGEILNFKWNDWFKSMEIETNLHKLPTIWPNINPTISSRLVANLKVMYFNQIISSIERKGKFVLSKESLFDQKKYQLKEVFYNFNREQRERQD